MDTFDHIQGELHAALDDEPLYLKEDLLKLKVAELRDILSSHELLTYGTKKILIERLLNFVPDTEVLEVESTVIITEETEKELDDEPKRSKPVKGIKV